MSASSFDSVFLARGTRACDGETPALAVSTAPARGITRRHTRTRRNQHMYIGGGVLAVIIIILLLIWLF
jgi:hypothetical protein